MRFKVQNSAKTCVSDAFSRTKMLVWGGKVLSLLAVPACSPPLSSLSYGTGPQDEVPGPAAPFQIGPGSLSFQTGSQGETKTVLDSCEDSFHLVRVYAILNPIRSAFRWELLPGDATIIARSHPWSKAYCIRWWRRAACSPRRRNWGTVAEPPNSATPWCMHSTPAAPGVPSYSARKHGLSGRAAQTELSCSKFSMSSGCWSAQPLALVSAQSADSSGPMTRTLTCPGSISEGRSTGR